MPDLTITAFIAARLAEDEAMATAATRGEWRADPEDILVKDADPYWDGACVANASGADGAHIARHDPARVLRDVAAKRAMVAEHQPVPTGAPGFPPGGPWCCTCGDPERYSGHDYPCFTIRAIAAVWSGHGDYKPAWAPATA